MRLRFYLALGLALVVLTTGGGSPAHALVKPEEVLKQGGQLVKSGKGITKFGRLVPGPVGGILAAGSLAWWAYETLDGSEVFAPQPGGTVEDYLGASPAAYPSTLDDGVMVASIISVSGRTVTFELGCKSWVHHSGSTPNRIYRCAGAGVGVGGNFALGTNAVTVKDVDCRNTTTGAHTVRVANFIHSRAAYITESQYAAQSPPKTYTTTFCNTGEVPDGFRIGTTTGTNPQSSTWFQTAPIGWGTMTGGQTWPAGELTFESAVIQAKCKNAETGAVQTVRATSAWGASGTLALPSCKARLGDEWYGVGVKVIPMDPEIDDVPLDPEVWPDWDVPDFMPEEWQEDITPEEEADPCHGTRQGCGLAISIDGEPVFPGEVTRTKIDTLRGSEPDRVTCKWGTREVDWKYCIPLLPTFEPGAGNSTTTDPTKPGTDTNVPTTGTGTQPVPTEAKSCMKAAFSWNPVDWVFVPVKCALQWAFKPTTPFSTRIARVKTAFENKPPFSWLLSLGSMPSISGAGCPTHWQFTYKHDEWPILCGTAMGDALHAFRPVSVVLVLGAAVYPFLRALVYAAFPIVKPVPHD